LKTELSLSDEWETPQELYDHLCEKYDIHPLIDATANVDNTKCQYFVGDALHSRWTLGDYYPEIVDVWCNPPHSKNEEFVKRAYAQWVEHDITIMMILPANALCTNYAENWIAPYAEYHPINRKFCKFLLDGKKKDSSRNGYFVVIWRKR